MSIISRVQVKVLFSSLFVLLSLLAAPAVGQEQRLTVERAIDLKSVRSPAIGPDGRWAAYELSLPRGADEEPGGSHTEIWVLELDTDGAEPRRFPPRGVDSRSPAWAPDGKSLAFLSQRAEVHEHTQLFLAPIDGGEASALTKHESSIGSFEFSPDGGRIAFRARDAKSAERKEAEKLGHDWIVVDEVHEIDRLWILDLESGETTPAHEGPFINAGSFVWTPAGDALILHGSHSPAVDVTMMYSRLYRVPLGGGTPWILFETEGKLGDLEVSPDGRQLAFLGATDIHDPLAQTVFVGPVGGGNARRVSEDQPFGEWSLGASVSELTWIDDDSLLVGATRGTQMVVSRVGVTDGSRQELAVGGSIRSLDLDRASGRYLATADSSRHPAEIAVGSIDGGGLKTLTNVNPELAELELAEPVTLEWAAPDGERIEGVLHLPVGAAPGAKHPLVVNPHGGPEGADRLGWDWIAQLFAARGYVVLQPNYRGSSGRGVAWSKADHHDLGGKEFDDLLAGIDSLVGSGLVDPERVGIGGWSYGGYFSALGATHHSERFKCAMMGAGISNWISFQGTTDIPHENYLVHWERWLPGNDGLLWERSPLSAIEKANTPTLILHGAGDKRVPPSQATEMYRALKDKGIETELVLYPRAGHGVRERAHRIDLFTRELEWFDRFLK